MIGKTISHYRIIEKLGAGGMGIVYKAEDINLKRVVALKFLPPELTRDAEAKKRFVLEAQSASSLEHSNICNIHAIEETEDGRTFMVMAFYEGETLKEKISRGLAKIEEVVDVSIQICEGLKEAHGKGIVHRDIKSSNVMIASNGSVKILDFGLAILSGRSKITKTGSALGTVEYMSPEQARGEKVDLRTDIWSLGVVQYEMLTGQLPFQGSYDPAVVYSILNETHDPVTGLRSGVPMELERIVNKALNKRADERYQNVSDLLVDLRNLRKELEKPDRKRPARPERPDLQNSLKRVWKPAAAGLVLLLTIFLLWRFRLREAIIHEPTPVAVLGFENQTGDPAYDYLQKAIPNLLITSLEQSKYFRVTTWERMHDLLKQTGKEGVDLIDKDLGFELCSMDGINHVVLGSFIKAGELFATELKVLDVTTKKLISSASSKGEGVASILNRQIDELSREISKSIGLSERKITGTHSPVSDVTTNSMEAYQFYLRGKENHEKSYYNEANRYLLKAVELDSNFAIAYLYLARTYAVLRYVQKELEAYEKAKDLSERATEKERLYIEAAYAWRVENNKEKRTQIYKLIERRYPKEKLILYYQANDCYGDDRFSRAIQLYQKALRLDPEYGLAINGIARSYAKLEKYDKAIEYYSRYTTLYPGDADPIDSMAEVYYRMGKLDEAIQKYKQALKLKPDFGSELNLAYLFALQEDFDEAVRRIHQFIAASHSPGNQAQGYIWLGVYEAWLGKPEQALIQLKKGKELFQVAGNEYGMSVADLFAAFVKYDFNDNEGSKQYLQECLVQFQNQGVLFDALCCRVFIGLLDVREGRVPFARSGLAEIESFSRQTDVIESYLADAFEKIQRILHMELLVAEGDINGAISASRKLPPERIPDLGLKTLLIPNIPFQQDRLAQIYLLKGDTARAIDEYENLVEFNPTEKNRNLIHPLYHYRLAILYEREGRRLEAIPHYEKFLDLWKDAESGKPEPDDARRRLAELKGS